MDGAATMTMMAKTNDRITPGNLQKGVVGQSSTGAVLL